MNLETVSCVWFGLGFLTFLFDLDLVIEIAKKIPRRGVFENLTFFISSFVLFVVLGPLGVFTTCILEKYLKVMSHK